MSITETKTINAIEIVGEHRVVQLQELSVITRDGVELASSFSRRSIEPGDDYSKENEEVQAVCRIFHTPSRIEAFQAATKVE